MACIVAFVNRLVTLLKANPVIPVVWVGSRVVRVTTPIAVDGPIVWDPGAKKEIWEA